MEIRGRVGCPPLPGSETLLTDEFVEYLVALHDRFTPRVIALREKRAAVLDRALKDRVLPAHPPVSEANTGDWQVPPVPDDLRTPGIEITGPASITGMFINALNPGPDGERAAGDLDDDEDAGGHRLIDTFTAARNRLAAVERTLTHTNPATGKGYFIRDGELPFFMHREKGLHLDEPEVTVDGTPRPGRDSGHRPDAVPRRPGADRARPGRLFLSGQDGVLRGGGLLARLLRLLQGTTWSARGRDHPGSAAGRVAAGGLPDGRDAV